MKQAIIVILAPLLIFTTLAAQSPTRTLSIKETAEISVSPDLCVMDILVETQDKDRNKAYNDNKDIMGKIISALTENEVETKDIQTTHFTVNPIYHSTLIDKHVFDGFKISTGLKIKVRDFAKILPIMNEVILAGATKISNVVFTLDDPQKHETAVRDKAMKAAKAKAEQMASLSGVSLGKPVNISEFPPPQLITYDLSKRYVAMAAGATDLSVQGGRSLEEVYVTLQPGEINLSYTVFITYELE